MRTACCVAWNLKLVVFLGKISLSVLFYIFEFTFASILSN